MAQKYSIIYNDVVNIEHECQIFDDDYTDDVIDILGTVFLDSSTADDNLEAIRGQGLRVELEADQDMTYEDLWSEEEKTFPVIYIRDSVTLFQGWLNPEGWFEDFVRDKWYVSFDCVDGLGYLTNLSFVNTDGTFITGRKTQLEVIRLALLRTGLENDINTSIDIYYTGLATTVNVLENVYVSTDRYIKDDDNTRMSCEEVIRDILEPYGAVIKGFGTAWYIYKPNQLYKIGAVTPTDIEQTFYNYDFEGTPGTDVTIEFAQLIGSAVDDFLVYHCSENQSFGIASSTGAYRISYKYGFAKDLLGNKFLFSADGISIDGWTIDEPTEVTLPGAGESGVFLALIDDPPVTDVVMHSDDITAGAGTSYSITVTFKYLDEVDDSGLFTIKIKLVGGSGTWEFSKVSQEWKLASSAAIIETMPVNAEKTFVVETVSVPEAGDLFIEIRQPSTDLQPSTVEDVFLSQVLVSNLEDAPTDVLGEFHTFQRTTKPSAQVQDIKEVATGDNPDDIYEGTIYKTDSTTPTETWFRKDITEAKPILQVMGEELMRMNQLPSRVYSGDIFGYINYFSVITINNQDGLFMALEYSYNTKANIISLVLRRIFGDELTDLDYEKTFDYGNTVRPTIIG